MSEIGILTRLEAATMDQIQKLEQRLASASTDHCTVWALRAHEYHLKLITEELAFLGQKREGRIFSTGDPAGYEDRLR